jgi:hypothetical protein
VAAAVAVAAAAALGEADKAWQVDSGCTNDTSCLVHGGSAWQCVQAAASHTGAALPTSSPCHINGRQRPRPDGGWDWPSAACTCRSSSCHGAPPSPMPGSFGYGCTAGRCVQMENNGTANSSGTCEWSTGCVPLHANEWIAAPFEWHLNGTSLTCVHASTFLKKSQLASGGLQPDQKRYVPIGTVVELTVPPKPMAGSEYWLIACSSGSLCGTTVPSVSSTASAQQEPSLARVLPQYLMIGDSISLGYLAGVQEQLAGKFSVIHSVVRANCGAHAHTRHPQ